jgi:hypothetical protein
VTTISRVMSGHCSIQTHLERFRIVGDPICVCMMNYETVDHIIWSRFEVERRQLLLETRGREYKRTLLALLVDIRNLKRTKRKQVEKMIFCGLKHIVRSY